ncbi:MAG TPA: M4 family metallopeptidase, partial [Anaerolineales bacterium]|nr:M4 family metallopeptidase [Anaerolineales bacterium]
MRTFTRLMTLFAVFMLLFSSFSTQALADPEAPPTPGESGAGTGGLAPEIADLELEYHAGTGKVRFMRPSSGLAIPQPGALAAGATPQMAAMNFLAGYGEMFGLRDPASELTVMKERTLEPESAEAIGRSFVRYQQVYQGIPIMGGELIVQLDAKNEVRSVSGEVLPDLAQDTRPRLSAEAAAENARASISKLYELEAGSMLVSTPELWIYNPVLTGGHGVRQDSLVWRMTVTHPERIDIRELVLVDARDGTLALNFNQVDTAKVRRIYDNNNTAGVGLPGNLARAEGGPVSGILDVNNAYDYSGFTYDFYNVYHGRDSIDDNGMVMVNTTRYCYTGGPCPFANAFWNGLQMVYGAGYASADDVVGHELTHGVTEHESRLYYYMQSGAINEAFSDIWGEFIDQTYTNGLDDDSAGVKWLMGEDIGAIRSMSNPPAYGDPDRMNSANYYCGNNDNGGVHWNSGVANKATFLMTDGGTFNGQTVAALGKTKVAKIWYEAATNLLTSGSDYQDLGSALNLACQNLVGTAGITAANCQEVSKAVTATEMMVPPSCPASEAPLCTNNFLNSQFNGSSAGWTEVYQAGDWYTTSGTFLETDGVAANKFSTMRTNDSFGDLDISVRMRRLGSNTSSNGIILRGEPNPVLSYDGTYPWKNGYWFAYTDGGSFSVWKWQNGSETALKSWTASGAIVADTWNILRVVANGPNFTFYINGTKVWEGADDTHLSGMLGLGMYRQTTDTGDLFSVDYATASGGTPVDLWFDNLENPISGNWGSGALSGTNNWRYPQNSQPDIDPQNWFTQDPTYGTSGSYNLYGFNQPAAGDDYIQMTEFASRPAGVTTYLHFKHAYEFEGPAWDGGVLEYQLVNGGPWIDAGPLFINNGYTGTISGSTGNPLGGRSAFVDDGQGMRSSRLSLGSGGGNIRFRFRKGTDNSVRDRGWFIDDVRIYTCANSTNDSKLVVSMYLPPAGQQPFHSAFNGNMVGWQVHNSSWGTSDSYLVSPGLANLIASSSYTQNYTYLNLIYTARMIRSGCESCANFIIVRGNPSPLNGDNFWDDAYTFMYSNDGQYSILKSVNGSYTTLQPWTATPAILASDEFGDYPNVLRVSTLGSSMSFYINGVLMTTVNDATFSSGKVGVGFYDGGAENQLSVDWAMLYPWFFIIPLPFEEQVSP